MIGLWQTRHNDLPCILTDTDVSFIGSSRSTARLSWVVSWLVGWLIGWLVDWLVGWLIG